LVNWTSSTQFTVWRKIFEHHISEKDLKFKSIKETMQLGKTWAKNVKRCFTEKET
jgi:hypothetical protein